MLLIYKNVFHILQPKPYIETDNAEADMITIVPNEIKIPKVFSKTSTMIVVHGDLDTELCC